MSGAEAEWSPVLRSLLDHMLKVEASDLYVTAGSPPVFRIDGVGYPAKNPFTADQVAVMAESLLSPAQRDEFRRTLELNLALALASGGRFRANLFRQRGAVGMVIRLVRTVIRPLAELGHPPVLADVMRSKRGLVLVVGGTGSGKSTTLAAMIDHRNRVETGHIITVEDPVEFIHGHQQCVTSQREVGIDTLSYENALRNAMREAPNVIMIGEIRDRETMQQAIAYAETGHLCLSTLHANNANQTLDRILNFFPDTARHQLLIDLSLNLKAVVSQRLLHAVDGTRVPAVELMLVTAYISDLIEKGEIATIREAMKQKSEVGMQTFDQALYTLYAAGTIGYAEALEHADSRTDLALQIRLQGPPPHERARGVIDGPDAPLALQLGR
ncbi:MAG TPA: PilT/PilU family type 4a pilus ATPase [Kofleriaceae bacterium]